MEEYYFVSYTTDLDEYNFKIYGVDLDFNSAKSRIYRTKGKKAREALYFISFVSKVTGDVVRKVQIVPFDF